MVFFGNCQAQGLAGLYKTHFALEQGDDVTYADSQNVLTDSETSTKALREADVVVIQIFDFPTKLTAAHLRPNCQIFKFPSVVAGFYWPFASQPHILTPKGLREPPYPAQLGDRYLNALINKGIEPEQALDQYLALDIAAEANVDRLLELYLDRQRKRDTECECNVAAALADTFRRQHTFLTPDHPNLGIFSVLAQHVYRKLGIRDADVAEVLAMQLKTPFPASALPIHPKLIDHFGLTFVNADSQYPFWDEGSFTFKEYMMRYLKHEWNSDLRKAIHGNLPVLERLPLLKSALEISPHSALGWLVLGNLLLERNLVQDALKAVEKSYDLDPSNPDLWGLRVNILLHANDIDGAEKVAIEAISTFPHAPSAHRQLNDVATRRGRWNVAISSAKEIVRLRRGDPGSYSLLGRTFVSAGDVIAGELALRKALDAPVADVEAAHALALLLQNRGKLDEAAEVLINLGGDFPTDPHIWASIGNLNLRRENAAAAEKNFREAIKIDPAFHGFQNGLAICFLRQGRFNESVAIVHPLVEEGTRDPHVYATLAYCQSSLNDLAGAEITLRKGMALGARLWGLDTALADICWRSGRADEALEILTQAGLESNEGHIYARLGDFETRLGNHDRAATALMKATALKPDSPEFRLLLAESLLCLKRIDEAERILFDFRNIGNSNNQTVEILNRMYHNGGNNPRLKRLIGLAFGAEWRANGASDL